MNTGWKILGLNMKCPSQIQDLNAWSSAGNSILRSMDPLESEALVAVVHWGRLLGWTLSLLTSGFALCFLVHCVVKSFCHLPSTMNQVALSCLPYYDEQKTKANISLFLLMLLLTDMVSAM